MATDRTGTQAGTATAEPRGAATRAAYERGFFGHPRGLSTLFFTEMWERFGYYGMRALLILFMTAAITDKNAGLGFSVEEAGALYGLFIALVYLLALPGGWVADRILGQRRTVLVGGIIIAAGYYCMALPSKVAFFISLLLVILGTGLLKPNISTMVGELYPDRTPEGSARRDAGFSIFYMGINTGAFISPIVCGWLGQKVNWHFGFAAAGVGLVFGLVQYVAGRKYLVPVSIEATPQTAAVVETEREMAQPHVPFTKLEWSRIAAASILTLFSLVFWAGFEQAGSSLNLFADRATHLVAFGYTFPSSWFQSVEALFVIIFSPVFAWIWISLGRHEPSSPTKFTLGMFFLSMSFLLIVPAARAYQVDQARVSPWWLIGLYFLQMLGELSLSPVGLSMITKLAPARIAGLLMGVWFLAMGLGNFLAGSVAALIEHRPFAAVFTIAFSTLAVATLLLAVLVPVVKRLMAGVK